MIPKSLVLALTALLPPVSVVHAQSIYGDAGDYRIPVSLYLAEAGRRYDVYFTLEQLGRDARRGLYGRRISVPGPPRDIEEIVYVLEALGDVRVDVSGDCDRILHVRQLKDADADSGSPLDIALSEPVTFRGSAGELLKKLDGSQDHLRIRSRNAGFFPDSLRSRSARSEVLLDNYMGEVRDCLGAGSSLGSGLRILWVATVVDGEPVEVSFLGGGASRGLRPVEDVVGFHTGEFAFHWNERDEDNAKSAEQFINRWAYTRPTNVRWALRFLGEIPTEESAKTLVDHIDWKYTECHRLDNTYPVMPILEGLGEIAVPAVLRRIDRERDGLVLELLFGAIRRTTEKSDLVELLDSKRVLVGEERFARISRAMAGE